LGVRFRHFFELVVHKYCTISLMSALGWEEGGDMEMEETVVGMGGRDLGRVSHYVTMYHCSLMLQIPSSSARSLCRLHGSWCLPTSHISGRPPG
jgi:hypothetical protein